MKIYLACALLMSFGVAWGQSSDMIAEVRVTADNIVPLSKKSLPFSVARSGHRSLGVGGVEAFLLDESTKKVFSLSKGIVYSTSFSSREVLGNWPLGAYPCGDEPECSQPWWDGRWGEDELLEQEIIDLYPNGMAWADSLKPSATHMMGCMLDKAPLRYGDVDGDGNNELVVLIENYYSIDFILFSPQKKKTIFAAKLDHNDVISNEEAGEDLLYKIPQNERYQYWSKYWSRTGVSTSMTEGYKSFAKIFFGDYDSDGVSDLLVWRKLFEPYKVTESKKGFQLKRNTYGHYKLVNGEYRLQDTGTADIKGWLTANDLTWQQGYPTASECSNEEGELIAEMHDPLLNDPEVLQ